MWQAMLALGVALIGFLGVVIGAVVAGFVTLRQAQLANQREREAQQMLRWQARKDAHDAFQRDAILALQDAVEDYWQLVTDWYNQVTGATTAKGNEPPTRPPYELMLRRDAHYGRLNATRARVFDDELRKLAEQVQHRGIMVTQGKSRDLKEWAWSRGRRVPGPAPRPGKHPAETSSSRIMGQTPVGRRLTRPAPRAPG